MVLPLPRSMKKNQVNTFYDGYGKRGNHIAKHFLIIKFTSDCGYKNTSVSELRYFP